MFVENNFYIVLWVKFLFMYSMLENQYFMYSLLIKNLKMPKSCWTYNLVPYTLLWFHDNFCIVLLKIILRFLEVYPLNFYYYFLLLIHSVFLLGIFPVFCCCQICPRITLVKMTPVRGLISKRCPPPLTIPYL